MNMLLGVKNGNLAKRTNIEMGLCNIMPEGCHCMFVVSEHHNAPLQLFHKRVKTMSKLVAKYMYLGLIFSRAHTKQFTTY